MLLLQLNGFKFKLHLAGFDNMKIGNGHQIRMQNAMNLIKILSKTWLKKLNQSEIK